MHNFQKKKNNTFFALLSMPSTAMGFALSIQISALSWILTTQYNLDIHDVGLVWAAGPLAGILGQVIIGIISDKVWFWNGRRRPFILIGGILSTLMLLALPNLHIISAGLGVNGILGIAIAVALTLDLSINVSFNPTRSIIADVTNAGDERTKGYTWMQSISGTFGVLAYAIGAFWDNYVLIYGGAVIVLLFSIVPTLFISEPREISDVVSDGESDHTRATDRENSIWKMLIAIRPLWGFLVYDIYAMGRRLAGIEVVNYNAEIACGLITLILLIRTMLESSNSKQDGLTGFRKVIAAHSFSWVGIQAIFVFLVVFLRQQFPDLSDIEVGRVGSMSLMILSAVGALLPATVLMPLARRIGPIRTHVISMAFMTVGYVGLYLFGTSPISIYILIGVVGIGWAALVSLPFAIVSEKISQGRMGLFMGLFNLSVVLPQLVVSLGVALMVSNAPDKSIIFAIAAISTALSTIAWGFVRKEH